MPVINEEGGALRKRSHWPASVAVGVLALLLVTVAVLPLAECHLAVGPVGIDCGRNAPGLAVDLTPFYYSSGDFYRVRVGSWYWQLEIY